MGLMSWIWPSEDERIATGNGYIEAGRWADAREAVWGIERADAIVVLHHAENELARKNLDEAARWCEGGDYDRVRLHMELAEELHHGGLEQLFRSTRRQLRELRTSHNAKEQLKREEKEARLMAADPLGISGGGGLFAAPRSDGYLESDEDEKEARLALIIENYPDHLKDEVEGLGMPFGKAILDLDDGRPDLALPALLELGDEFALVRWERARAAYAMGDPKAATKELRAFAARANGHFAIGQFHTGVLLSQWTAESGDPAGALRVLRDLRTQAPKLGGFLFGRLLFTAGELEEAEAVVRELIKSAPRSDALYGLLAQIRLAGGHREAAIAALEGAMNNVCSTPGRCGNKPPNRDIVRMLATLYLEDGSDVERGLELSETAVSLLQGDSRWDDAYLMALAARHGAQPDAGRIADTLYDNTPPQHPGRKRLEQYLPEMA